MSSDETKPHLILTVHGIRTFGHWQERLESLVADTPTGSQTEFVCYKFGYFSAIAFVVPIFRWLVVRRFRNELRMLCSKKKRTRIDLVGHSFGTHILAWALMGLERESSITIHTVILAGSVLRAEFPWRELLGSRVMRLINDCGTKDHVLLLSQFLVLFTGMAGRTGFSGAASVVFRNRYSNFGHGGYFVDRDGVPDDSYIKEHWLPLLTASEPIPLFDHRQELNWIDGALIAFGNNAEPVKIILYAAPFALLAMWMYLQREEARLQAKIAQAGQLAAESQLATIGRPEMLHFSVLLAAASHSIIPSSINRSVISRGLQLLALPGAAWKCAGQATSAIWSTNGATALVYGNNSMKHLLALPEAKELPWTHQISFAGPTTISADGKRLVTATGKLLNIKTRDGELLHSKELANEIAGVAVDESGKAVAVSFKGYNGVILSADSGMIISEFHDNWPIERLMFSPRGNYLATWGSTYEVAVWEVSTGKRLAYIEHASLVQSVRFSPDENWVAVGSWDHKVTALEIANAKRRHALEHKDRVYSVEFSTDGKYLATAGVDGEVKISSVEEGGQVGALPHRGTISALRFIKDDKFLAVAGDDRTVRVWHWRTGREVSRLLPESPVVGIAPIGDSSTIATVTQDCMLRLWRLDLTWPDSPVDARLESFSVVSPNGRYVTVNDPYEDKATVWKAATGEKVASFEHDTPISAARYEVSGKYIATSDGREAIIWRIQDGAKLWSIPDEPGSGHYMTFSGDGALFFTTEKDKGFSIWNWGNNELLSRLQMPAEIKSSDDVDGATFSSDGSFFVMSTAGRMLFLRRERAR